MSARLVRGTLPLSFHDEDKFKEGARRILTLFPPKKQKEALEAHVTMFKNFFKFGEGIVNRILLKISMSVNEAFEMLEVPMDINEREADKKYRQLSLKYHPDKGGSVEDMQRLNVAKDIVDSYLDTEKSKTESQKKWEEKQKRWKEEKQKRIKMARELAGKFKDLIKNRKE